MSEQARAALLTGDGRGAVGVVRVSGASALAIVDRLLRPARGPSLAKTPRNRPRFGRIGPGPGDEVVALVLEGVPPSVEIHGHGGAAALASILSALASEGVEAETSANSIDSVEVALASAPTLRVAQILLDQAGGAFARAIAEIGADPSRVEALLRRGEFGMRLLEGWRIVLTGRPNVGKSRLLNALAGFDRAIVSPRAGTTRDVVTVRTAIDGWPVEIADTAGVREAGGALEEAGIALARAACTRADAVVVVLDRGEPMTDEDRRLLDEWPGALRVANKADRPALWEGAPLGAISVSALTGEGIPDLITALSARVVPDPPPEGAVVPFRAEHLERLLAMSEGGPVRRAGPAPQGTA